MKCNEPFFCFEEGQSAVMHIYITEYFQRWLSVSVWEGFITTSPGISPKSFTFLGHAFNPRPGQRQRKFILQIKAGRKKTVISSDIEETISLGWNICSATFA